MQYTASTRFVPSAESLHTCLTTDCHYTYRYRLVVIYKLSSTILAKSLSKHANWTDVRRAISAGYASSDKWFIRSRTYISIITLLQWNNAKCLSNLATRHGLHMYHISKRMSVFIPRDSYAKRGIYIYIHLYSPLMVAWNEKKKRERKKTIT